MKAFDAHAGEHTERRARADAADLQEAAEELALGLGDEAVQHVRVLAHEQMGDQRQRLADLRKLVEGRHRRVDLVPDASDLDRQRRRSFRDQCPLQETDHRPTAAARLAESTRECAWQIATASASAASVGGAFGSPSRRATMYCTCAISAPPCPTTAFLTWRGEYSKTGTFAPKVAHSAAALACPSFSALSALRWTKTLSIAISAGAYSSQMRPISSKMRRSRS